MERSVLPSPSSMPRASRRWMLSRLGAGSLATTTVAAACGVGSQTAGVPAAPAGTVGGTLTLGINGGQAQWDGWVKQFDALNPGVKSTVVIPPGGTDHATLVITMSAAGTPPDMLYVNNDQIAAYATKGLLAPLDAYLARDKKDVSIYHPVALKAYQAQGKQFAMPGDINPVGMYFNRTLFEEAGVPLPSKDYKQTRWTQDELLEAAKKLTRTRADGTKQFGFAVDSWIGRWYPVLWGNGGDAFDNTADPKTFTFVSKETEETLQWLADLRAKHQVSPQTSDLVAPTPNVTELFKAGRVAMVVDLSGSMNGIDRVEGLKWENGPVSRGPKGRFARLGGAGYGVHPEAKNKETAWAFVKFFTGPESPKFSADRATTIPPVKEGLSSASLMRWVPAPAKKVWMDTLDYGRVQPAHVKWQDVMEGEGARKHYMEAIEGKRSVKDVLELIKQHAGATLR